MQQFSRFISLLFVFFIFYVRSDQIFDNNAEFQFEEFDEGEHEFRRLQAVDVIDSGKTARMAQMVINAEAVAIPYTLTKESWSKPHNQSEHSQVIFTAALSNTYIVNDVNYFLGTARKAGFTGDIVVVVLSDVSEKIMTLLKEYNAIVYKITLSCTGVNFDIRCKVPGREDFPITLIRNYAYKALAMMYPKTSFMMLSDFRDVLFQSNPFKFKPNSDWAPPTYQLIVTQDSHPNRVISRCAQNVGFIATCYGWPTVRKLGSNTISSNGVVFGSRDAIVVYNHLILQQSNPNMRPTLGANLTTSKCISFGVDQGFHNWLIYSGKLSHYMDVKIFQQGEGPVNTVGGFYGEKKILKALLSDWKILRGDAPFKYIYNWNGEISPVVHQLDRYLTSELQGGYKSHMAVFQKG